MKKLNILLLAIPFAMLMSGCATEKKKRDRALSFFATHPQEAAAYCANAYPVRDSIGETIITPADNEDYTGKIESLGNEIDFLQEKLRQDSVKASAGGQITAQELSNYKSQVNTLQKKYSDLQRSYKPCEPEIRERPVYRENTARVAALQLKSEKLQEDYNDQKDELAAAQKQAQARLWMLISAGILAGAYIILKIYKIIKF